MCILDRAEAAGARATSWRPPAGRVPIDGRRCGNPRGRSPVDDQSPPAWPARRPAGRLGATRGGAAWASRRVGPPPLLPQCSAPPRKRAAGTGTATESFFPQPHLSPSHQFHRLFTATPEHPVATRAPRRPQARHQMTLFKPEMHRRAVRGGGWAGGRAGGPGVLGWPRAAVDTRSLATPMVAGRSTYLFLSPVVQTDQRPAPLSSLSIPVGSSDPLVGQPRHE